MRQSIKRKVVLVGFVLINSLILCACATRVEPFSHMPLILNFDDFGPISLGEGLLGDYKYAWPDPDNQQETARNISVVIYQAGDIEQVRAEYQPNRGLDKQDYRFIELSNARAWLDDKIANYERRVESGGEGDFSKDFDILKRLYHTQIALEQHF